MSTGNVLQTSLTWSYIEENAVNLEKLRLLCNHQKALKQEGYVTAPLTSTALLSKLRCRRCGDRMKPPRADSIAVRDDLEWPTKSACQIGAKQRQRNICEFHPGRVHNLQFTCCQAHVSIQKGCHVSDRHEAPENYNENLLINWTFHNTPIARFSPPQPQMSSNRRRGRGRFQNLTLNQHRNAIALDCEFGTSVLNEAELIRITAIDFFTKQILMDDLVKPDVTIKNYLTRYSGVTSASMREAVRKKQCFFGRDAARERLLEFVGPGTIIVLHGGSSDMSSLRLIHPNIIDTYILETYLDPVQGGRSLKNLCQKKFGMKIQGGRGHDSHEDALACRELAIWIMNQIPDA